MDPLSHVLFGRTLIALDNRRRLGPGAIAACALGALAPDVDALFTLKGWDVYLRVHEIGTHSVIGSVAVASGVAALMHVLQRGSRYSSLMLAAAIGALSHLAFDVCSGAIVRPGWPLFQERLSVPLVAMADPWVVGICVTGAVAVWLGRHSMAATAAGVLVTMGTFLALKFALMASALPQWAAARGPDPIVSHAVEAGWGVLTEWNVYDRTPHALRKWRVNAFGDNAILLFSLSPPPESPIVATSRSLDTVQNFLRVHELGFAVSAPLEKGNTRVLWSDIRYCRSGASATTLADDAPLACSLWFGGTFDRDRRPLTQVVVVGNWLQIRPAGP
jgi:membrane-bound metal-dependent hydrolase YbcI (DUF457 family)